MSFVTTQPAELLAAASTLQTIGTAMADQNAAAVMPTTMIAPAAADEVSALQATQFAAFGKLYQSVSAQATAIHQMLVQALDANAGSYGGTEAANQSATGSTSLSGLGSMLGGSGAASTPAAPLAGSTPGTAGGTSTFAINGAQNFAAAGSDLISMASIGTLPGFGAPAAGGSVAGVSGVVGAPALALSDTGAGAAPVLASAGQAPAVGSLSVPPSWTAGQGVPVSSATAAPTPTGTGWTTAVPNSAPGAVPAGMPSMASAGRGGRGFGAPRYGTKPTVMPRPLGV